MKKVLHNIPIYAVGNVLPQVIGFLLLPLYTRYMSPEQYGIANSMQLLQMLLIVFMSLCLDRSIFRLYWDYKTEQEKKGYLGTLTIAIIGFAAILTSLLFMFRAYTGRVFSSIEFFPYYSYSILYVFLSMFTLIPMSYFMLKQKAADHFKLSFMRFLLETGLVVWFVVVHAKGAEGMLLGRLLGIALLTPVFIGVLIKIGSFKFDIKILKPTLMYSLPIIPGIIGAWVLDLSDRIFIERYFTLSDVGIYGLGYKIAGIVGILAGAVSMAYTPYFFELANTEDQKSVKGELYRYNNIFILAIISIGFVVALFSKEFVVLFLDEKYQAAYKYMIIICMAYVLGQAAGLVGLFFKQSKKMKQEMYITVGIAGINIILNFLLVPKYGAYGAAYATVISFFIGFLLSYLYARKNCYYIPFNWKLITPALILSVGIILLFYLGINYDLYETLIIKALVLFVLTILFLKKYYSQIKSVLRI